MSLAHLRILLTGANGGIGAAMARALAARGAALLVTGLDRLAAALDLPAGRCLAVAADLTDPVARARLVHAALTWEGGVNALVNNAGQGQFGLFADTTPQQLEALLAANVAAPLHLCRALLPRLQTLPVAHVVNVGSVLGAIGHPGHALYCASKFALRSFADSLRNAEPGLRVTSVHPGRIATEMQEDLVAYEGRDYDPTRFLSPETVAHVTADAIHPPRDGHVREVILRPR